MLTRVLELRLTEKMRREEGATYSPSVGTSMGRVFPDYGYISTGLDLKPDDTQRFRTEMLDLGKAIASDGFTDDEFARAKAPVLESIEESLERNAYWLSSVVSRAQTRPQDLEDARSYKSTYEEMTREEVEAVAKTYLKPSKTARFIILPPEKKND
jgi:zinc protease